MEKRMKICDYLRENHTGRGKAVYSRELQQIFNLDGRSLRRKINRLRQEGEPICSCENGYYYAENQRELDDTIFRLNELAAKVTKAKSGMEKPARLDRQTIVMEITIRVREVCADAQ